MIRSTPPALLAVLAVAVAHTVMVSVMVMTPVHMRHEGAELEVVGIVISVHVAGMYALSPVVGWLSDRLGRVAVLVIGNVVLLCAVLVSGRAAVARGARCRAGAPRGGLVLRAGRRLDAALGVGAGRVPAVGAGGRGLHDGALRGCRGSAGRGGDRADRDTGPLNALAGALALPMLVLAGLALPAVRARRVGA